MNDIYKFHKEDISVFFHILGSKDDHLPRHLWEEVCSYCDSKQVWGWNSFDKIPSFMNRWINQYNKSLELPVLIAISALKIDSDRLYYVLSDSFFATVIKDGFMYFIGQSLFHSQIDSVVNQKEIIVPSVFLGAQETLPAHIVDEILGCEVLIFPNSTSINKLQSMFYDSGSDFESFQSLIDDDGITYLSGRFG